MTDHPILLRALLSYAELVPYHRGKAQIIRQAIQAFHLTVTGDQLVKRRGLQWVLNPADAVQADLYWYGVKEMWEIYHLQQLTRSEAVFFDVGANFGYYSAILAASSGGACQVHAFEPNPPVYQKLLKHIELNHLTNINAYCLGLSDHKGSAGLSVKEHNSGLTQITTGNEIELTTLDDFCREKSIRRLDLMKIDVEGHEERVLCGSQDTLQRFRPALLIELNPLTLKNAGSNVDAVVDHLRKLEYTFYVAQRRRLLPLRTLPSGDDYVNAFCFPAESKPTC